MTYDELADKVITMLQGTDEVPNAVVTDLRQARHADGPGVVVTLAVDVARDYQIVVPNEVLRAYRTLAEDAHDDDLFKDYEEIIRTTPTPPLQSAA